MKTNIVFSMPPGPLRVGLVEAEGVEVSASSPAYLEMIREAVLPILAPGFVFPDSLQKGIRSLLKAYGFHPSGRNRPASEFLVKDVQGRGAFNPINNLVDINNHLSLTTNLPISIFDLDKTGGNLCLRLGLDEEKYIFNREGQEISLRNLIVVARSGGDLQAVGSPVKDSHATKISDSTRRILGVVYTSKTITPEGDLARNMDEFALLITEQAKATGVTWKILDSPS